MWRWWCQNRVSLIIITDMDVIVIQKRIQQIENLTSCIPTLSAGQAVIQNRRKNKQTWFDCFMIPTFKTCKNLINSLPLKHCAHFFTELNPSFIAGDWWVQWSSSCLIKVKAKMKATSHSLKNNLGPLQTQTRNEKKRLLWKIFPISEKSLQSTVVSNSWSGLQGSKPMPSWLIILQKSTHLISAAHHKLSCLIIHSDNLSHGSGP